MESRLRVDEGRIEGAELARRFAVTTETARRDLSQLDRQKMVDRVERSESVGFPTQCERYPVRTALWAA
jgi:predicted DNA-binding transcriptional regulator YafY